MIICILGRQPACGLAELESRFGEGNLQPLNPHAASVNADADTVPFHLLGGVVKAAIPITTLPTTDWAKAVAYCQNYLITSSSSLPDGKIKLGLSAYDLPVSLKTLKSTALAIKKAVKSSGRSIRVVPNTDLMLNSAQVLHNQLTHELGYELLFVRHGTRIIIARSVYVQDIDDYAHRDFGRPKRDAFVGMLPPKLAQIMLNLAQVKPGDRVLDPFCGTGVVLQEAALMGCDAYGTDVSDRMIEYSAHNLEWLQRAYHTAIHTELQVADATNAIWRDPIHAVACEVYLGKPLTTLPPRPVLQSIMDECNHITSRFLANLREQLAPGTRCVVAIPAWRKDKSFIHLKAVDDLEKMGYNRVSFKHAAQHQLIYHREGQVVARELLVLTVKE